MRETACDQRVELELPSQLATRGRGVAGKAVRWPKVHLRSWAMQWSGKAAVPESIRSESRSWSRECRAAAADRPDDHQLPSTAAKTLYASDNIARLKAQKILDGRIHTIANDSDADCEHIDKDLNSFIEKVVRPYKQGGLEFRGTSVASR